MRGEHDIAEQVCIASLCGLYYGTGYQEDETLIRTDNMLPSGTSLAGGKYCLEEPLGRGGFGITYAATQTALGRAVAIKEYFPDDGDCAWASRTDQGVVPHECFREEFMRGLDRFTREGRLLAEVTHPNIVRVIDLFAENGTAYLVMERVEGRSLHAERLAQPDGKLPSVLALAITAMLVDALALLHERRIYHLDIKPDNILLTPDGQAVLIDFGTARREFTRITRDGRPSVPVCTPEYAPPEVSHGGTVGPESDIFELGVTLHELLTGILPPPVNMRSRAWMPRGVGEPWRSLIARAIATRREDRPRNIRAWWAGRNGWHRRALIGTAAVLLLGVAALLLYHPPHQEQPVSPPTPSAPTTSTTVIPTPTPRKRPVARTAVTETASRPVPKPTTPPVITPTPTKPVEPPTPSVTTNPAPPEGGEAPTAAELPELLGYSTYRVSAGDRLIYGMGIAKDRRAAELLAKRNLLAGVRTLPGQADAGADALQGAQLSQEIRPADGGYCLIYILPMPESERE